MSEAAPKPVKAKAPKKPATHPGYGDMIKAAIVGLAEKQGSSLPAIKKAIGAKHKVRGICSSWPGVAAGAVQHSMHFAFFIAASSMLQAVRQKLNMHR
jgi:formylmethanofuran:tetrahydromethanopterin formyltransferase